VRGFQQFIVAVKATQSSQLAESRRKMFLKNFLAKSSTTNQFISAFLGEFVIQLRGRCEYIIRSRSSQHHRVVARMCRWLALALPSLPEIAGNSSRNWPSER
jgi:hypothetical protein